MGSVSPGNLILKVTTESTGKGFSVSRNNPPLLTLSVCDFINAPDSLNKISMLVSTRRLVLLSSPIFHSCKISLVNNAVTILAAPRNYRVKAFLRQYKLLWKRGHDKAQKNICFFDLFKFYREYADNRIKDEMLRCAY